MNERSRFTATVFVKKRKNSKQEKSPLFMRITLQGERTEIALNQLINPKDWDQKKQRSTKRNREAVFLNELIENSLTKVINCRSELTQQGQSITVSQLKAKFLGTHEKSIQTIQTFDLYLQKIKPRIGIDMAPITYERYQLCRDQLQRYIQYSRRKKDLPLTEINFGFLDDWEQYMRTIKKYKHNTTIKRLKTFRTIIKYAFNNRWIAIDPFLQISLKEKPVYRGHLTDLEVLTLREKDFQNERLSEIRDVFLFCCYTSLAYADVSSLTKNQFEADADVDNLM